MVIETGHLTTRMIKFKYAALNLWL